MIFILQEQLLNCSNFQIVLHFLYSFLIELMKTASMFLNLIWYQSANFHFNQEIFLKMFCAPLHQFFFIKIILLLVCEMSPQYEIFLYNIETRTRLEYKIMNLNVYLLQILFYFTESKVLLLISLVFDKSLNFMILRTQITKIMNDFCCYRSQ